MRQSSITRFLLLIFFAGVIFFSSEKTEEPEQYLITYEAAFKIDHIFTAETTDLEYWDISIDTNLKGYLPEFDEVLYDEDIEGVTCLVVKATREDIEQLHTKLEQL